MSSISSYFSSLSDPRVERSRLHSLNVILVITVAAILSGCNDWNEIELYGKSKQTWLGTFLPLANGIPSHDTFNRVFAALDPIELQQCFTDWVQNVASISNGQVISIDGKRMCNSGRSGKASIVHMVSAWSNSHNMVLAQTKTDDKSNEITAIPQLLNMLMLQGSIVTIDAMGCQTAIADKISSQNADYVLAVKGNQGHLSDDIQESFIQTPADQISMVTTADMGHGRIEKRTCKVITDTSWICKAAAWKELKSLILIESERIDKKTGDKQTQQRFYISSLNATPARFNEIIRAHWGIENHLHWCLDVVFKEDYSTKQAGTAAENFATITRIALNLIKNDQTKKTSQKNKRLLCGWDDLFMAQLIFKVF